MDSRLHDGENKAPEELYPVTWTFPERVPQAEVLSFMQKNEMNSTLDYPDARVLCAKYFFTENERILKSLTPAEREKYYAQAETIANAIQKVSKGNNHFRYRERRDQLVGSMTTGPLSKTSAEIVEANSKALESVRRLLEIEDKEKRQEELREFIRRTAHKKS